MEWTSSLRRQQIAANNMPLEVRFIPDMQKRGRGPPSKMKVGITCLDTRIRAAMRWSDRPCGPLLGCAGTERCTHVEIL
jgi:hypothetical protein